MGSHRRAMANRDDIPETAAIAHAVAARYGELATSPGSLSCGGALEVAAPREGEVVVDLGCGLGGDVVRAAALVGAGGLAIGVDASETMLAAARSRAEGLPNVQLVRSDLSAVALPGERADVVVSNCAINHAPNKRAVYREVYRLLRPGGRFVVSDIVAERELPPEIRNDAAAWAACYGGAIPEALYLEAIAAAGLEDVAVVRRTEPYLKGGASVLSITVQGRRV
jgi:arsenite methyltransferase